MVPLHLSALIGSDNTRERSGCSVKVSLRTMLSGRRRGTIAAVSGAHMRMKLVAGMRVGTCWWDASSARVLVVIGHGSGTSAERSRGAGRTRRNGAQNRSRVDDRLSFMEREPPLDWTPDGASD